MMTSRERMLRALNNERPDRLPCQVHGWMGYYLRTYLGGMDWFDAYERFGMDYAIYASPDYEFGARDQSDWQVTEEDLGVDADGVKTMRQRIETPGGALTKTWACNEFTGWDTEHLLKNEQDIEIYMTYAPTPVKADLSKLTAIRERLGDRGILRSHPFSPGQGSPWQSFCTLYGTEQAILLAMDQPDLVHAVLDSILQRTLASIELWRGTPADMVETGGGAGSNTVISPTMYREFCLPYDRQQNDAFRDVGVKTVHHLCGGVMKMLELVVESGADGLETMTPKGMGGDCNLAEASQRVGKDLFFIGGFDQKAGFENGTPEDARKQVEACFEATKDHAGYIISPSDHFFFGDPANVQAFADAARSCCY